MKRPPLLLGHRGTRVLRASPENTFAAFETALAQGGDGFEFDVRRTSDGEAVVVHDPKYRGAMVAKTGGKQLKALPRLRAVLEKYGGRCFLDIELKVKDLESEVLAALREQPLSRGYVVSSFLPEVLLELRLRRGGIPLGIICETSAQLKRGLALPVEYFILKEPLIREGLVHEAHAEDKRILAWTVNKPENMLELAKWGVDGLVSDDPALLVKTIRGESGPEAPSKRAQSASVHKQSRLTRRTERR
ncbi:MAG TPA: glycerophosphodiester phosphodiesterase [Terriglobales bacterium]|nr:glycerophosphodiester phosphodiesterase [Terriglobales bacterium]